MIVRVFRKELRLAFRSGRLLPLFAVWLILAALAAWGSLSAQRYAQQERASAAELDRRAWNQQGERNPHSAAHFGQYAYKPATALAALEPGLDAWLGTAIWMEAHYQNPAAQRQGEVMTPLSRMGALSLGWMLQILLPLTVIVLGFDLLVEERQRGTLKLQTVAGASVGSLFVVKSLSLLATVLIVTLPVWIAAGIVAVNADVELVADSGQRFVAWLGTYGAYTLIWILLTLAVSALASSARVALGHLSGLWLIGVLLLPRLAAEQAEAAYPAPEPSTFWTEIRRAQSEGIDGHSGSGARTQALQAGTLKRYGVEKMEDLPVSFAGIALQASEEYGNQVFDRFFGQLWDGYAMQAAQQSAYAWVAPVIAVRKLATGAAGTDLIQHRHFATAAEDHRRALQRFLNEDMIAHGKGKDFGYLAPADLWQRAPRFEYRMPALQVPSGAVVVLVAWLLVGPAGCVFAAWRLRQEPGK
jgi:ABC-2 type transport system permease protein